MCADNVGSCRVFNEIKVANVFGQYTSLLTGISVDFPCDPENFEEEALRYHARITNAIQNFQNRTLEAVHVSKDKGKLWHDPKSPTPGGKTVGVRKSPAKKSAGAPAAKKRVPRKR